MKNIGIANDIEMTKMVNQWIEEGNKLIDKFDKMVQKESVTLGSYYLAMIANCDRLARANPALWEEARLIVTAATKNQREKETN